ncbi:DMT family transporter [Mycoplasmopsis primatum]|uniref:DMT family transporter n=1 Tax=Mycoplasmopsis primatum TaxID=55604 RepID=UPI000496514F|nr:DMT family transporter [Mycoplasmopsis primatum]
MKFFHNKKGIYEVIGAILSAIFWATGGVILTIFTYFLNQTSNSIGTLRFGIITAFFIELFMLLWSLILVPIIKKKTNVILLIPFKNRKIWILLLSSFLGAPLGTAMYWLSLMEIGAYKATSISTVFPIFSTMCVYLFLKRKSSWNSIVGLFIAIVAAVSFGIIASWNEPNSWKGYLYIAIAIISWGLEAFLSSISLENDIDPYVSIFLRSLVSIITYICILLPSFGAYNWDYGISIYSKSVSNYFYLLVLIGLFTCISFMLYYRALNNLSVSKATSINITYSFWTMIFEPVLLLFDKMWKPYEWYIYLIGFTILIGAIFGLLDFSKLKLKKKSVDDESSISSQKKQQFNESNCNSSDVH